MMKKIIVVMSLALFCNTTYAADREVYLSCPGFDDRAPDLIVVLDKANGKASLQSPSSGVGLNFSTEASFGPDKVTWRRNSGSLKHIFSVDRSTLQFERKTLDTSNGLNHTQKTTCTIIKKNTSNKF